MTTQTTSVRISGYVTGMLVSIYVSDCPKCGVVFGINTDYEGRRRKDGATFYCPNGHGQNWKENEADRQRKRADTAARHLEWVKNEDGSTTMTMSALPHRQGSPVTTARTVPSVLRMSEDAWQQRVTDALTYYQWRWCHYRPARTVKGWRTPLEGHPGCLDLIIAGFGHVFVVELKTDAPSSRLTGDQQAWINVGGNYAAVWRPRDWPFVLRFIQSRYNAVSPIPTGEPIT